MGLGLVPALYIRKPCNRRADLFPLPVDGFATLAGSAPDWNALYTETLQPARPVSYSFGIVRVAE